jgi:hypothetical protein
MESLKTTMHILHEYLPAEVFCRYHDMFVLEYALRHGFVVEVHTDNVVRCVNLRGVLTREDDMIVCTKDEYNFVKFLLKHIDCVEIHDNLVVVFVSI